MKRRQAMLFASAAATALALAGCAGGPSGSTTTAADNPPSTASSSSSSSSSDPTAENHNDADVMFAQMMIPHHTQAVEMCDSVLAKSGLDPKVADLAQRIRDAQQPEIERMTGWLQSWGEPLEAPDGESGGSAGHDMGNMDGSSGADGSGGMMSDADMKKLEEADAATASQLFLQQMTLHHEGAVAMAKDEIEQGSNPEAIALAREIVATQEAEIEEMKGLLR